MACTKQSHIKHSPRLRFIQPTGFLPAFVIAPPCFRLATGVVSLGDPRRLCHLSVLALSWRRIPMQSRTHHHPTLCPSCSCRYTVLRAVCCPTMPLLLPFVLGLVDCEGGIARGLEIAERIDDQAAICSMGCSFCSALVTVFGVSSSSGLT